MIRRRGVNAADPDCDVGDYRDGALDPVEDDDVADPPQTIVILQAREGQEFQPGWESRYSLKV